MHVLWLLHVPWLSHARLLHVLPGLHACNVVEDRVKSE